MENEQQPTQSESQVHRKSWPERNVNTIIVGLVVACAATLIAQAVCQFELFGFHALFDEKHPAHFELETVFGFQAMFGFAAFVCVVFLGRALRLIVKREEGYYDS